MAQDKQPDLQVEGWLQTLGIESLCQWDVLVFLYRHQPTLVRAEHIARYWAMRRPRSSPRWTAWNPQDSCSLRGSPKECACTN